MIAIGLTIYMSITAGVVYEAGRSSYPSRAHGFTPGVWWGSCCSSCYFSVLWCDFVFCLSSSCVVCAQCCQCLRIVHSLLHLLFSLTFIYCKVEIKELILKKNKKSNEVIIPTSKQDCDFNECNHGEDHIISLT